MSFAAFKKQYIQTRQELSFNALLPDYRIKSLFEIGCGCGANLLLAQEDEMEIGGIDYSGSLIEVADKVLKIKKELICDEAINVPCDVKYDAILSNSVFSYFKDYDYAYEVLEKMYKKSNYSIGLIDIHDIQKKDEFINYRKELDANYEEKYRGLEKLFYDKKFFLDFAREHKMNIRFTIGDLDGYWNNEFVFHCFMTKQ